MFPIMPEFLINEHCGGYCMLTPENEKYMKEEREHHERLLQNYVKVICTKDAKPKFNRLQLRTHPPTFIELQPGVNFLYVEHYPALKYGFSQISENDENNPDETMSHCPLNNCQEVLEIDLSHFDSSRMISMDDMFYSMQNLKKIYFGDLDTSNVVSMVDTFRLTGNHDKLTLKFDTSNVERISGFLASTWYNEVELIGFDLRKVKDADQMMPENNVISLDEMIISTDNPPENIFNGDEPKEIKIKRCDKKVTDWIKQELISSCGEESGNVKIEIIK